MTFNICSFTRLLNPMNPSPDTASLSDEEIIARITAGETKRYAEIINKYNRYLYKVGQSYGYHHADIEDLIQETFISAYFNLSKFENRSSFKTWMVHIMLNRCYHRKMKFSFQKERVTQDTFKEDAIPVFKRANTDINSIVQNHELKNILESVIHHIPKDYRQVFTLREMEEMNVHETSEALHISESNVKVRLNRAKSMLQDEIKRAYATE